MNDEALEADEHAPWDGRSASVVDDGLLASRASAKWTGVERAREAGG